MNEFAALAGAAFVTGLLGSVHCLGMCAGISGIVAANAAAAGLRRQAGLTLAYNAGRLASYAFLGAVVAALGGTLVASIPALAAPIRFATGAIIVLIGLQVAFDLRLTRAVENAGAALWQKLTPVARRFVPVTTLPRALGLGLLWGWLPCGLVYSVLLMAAASARPTAGLVTMLAFGAGTLPAMLLTGLGAARLAQVFRRRGTRLGLGLLVVGLGIATIAMPVSGWLAAPPHHHG